VDTGSGAIANRRCEASSLTVARRPSANSAILWQVVFEEMGFTQHFACPAGMLSLLDHAAMAPHIPANAAHCGLVRAGHPCQMLPMCCRPQRLTHCRLMPFCCICMVWTASHPRDEH
jgi:hypothetical protein